MAHEVWGGCQDGPLVGMQVDLAKFCLANSDLVQMLRTFMRCQARPQEWWHRWSGKAFASIITLSGGAYMRVELGLEDPMWQVLRTTDITLDGQQRQRLAKAFYTTHKCCRREADAARLHSHLHGAEDLFRDPAAGLLNGLVKDGDVHVADVERLHKMSKDIARVVAPSAMGVERFACESFLQRAKRQHVSRGNEDYSRLTEKVLEHSGHVTLRQHRLKRQRQLRDARAAGKKKNHGGGALLFRNERQGKGVARISQDEVADLWRAQPPAVRADYNNRAAERAASAPDAGVGAAQAPQPVPQTSPFSTSDQCFPCSINLMAEELKSKTVRGGTRALGEKHRADLRKRLLIPDPLGWAPTPALHKASTCMMKHPGLCVTDHASIYRQAEVCSANLFVVLAGAPRDEMLAHFFAVEVHSGTNVIRQFYFCLAVVRLLPRLAVLVPADPVGGDGNLMPRLRSAAAPAFQFQTHFAFAALLLQGAPVAEAAAEVKVVITKLKARGSI